MPIPCSGLLSYKIVSNKLPYLLRKRPKKLLFLAVIPLWLLGVPSVSFAEPEVTNPAAQPTRQVPAECLTTQAPGVPQALPRLLDMLKFCQNHAPWLLQLGQLQNRAGQYAQAVLHLERAMLLQPGIAAIHIEYAIALAGTGQADAALDLISQVLLTPGLPDAIRTALVQQQSNWYNQSTASAHPQPGHSAHRRTAASFRLGHDSNLLGAPGLTSLTLSLPDQAVTLPLDSSYLPRAGMYTRTDLTWEAIKPTAGAGLLQAAVGLGLRNQGNATQGNSQQMQGAVEYSAPLPVSVQAQAGQGGVPWGGHLGAQAATYHTNSGARYRVLAMQAGVHNQHLQSTLAGVCATRLGIDWQDRNLQNNTVLSGRYTGLAATHGCQAATPGALWVQWSARLGVDHPIHPQRPGGRQQQLALRAQLGAHTATGHWQLDAEWFAQTDAQGYSALLVNGAARQLRRTSVRAEYLHPFATGWQLQAGIEWQRQTSNLVLFSQQSHGPYVALRRVW